MGAGLGLGKSKGMGMGKTSGSSRPSNLNATYGWVGSPALTGLFRICTTVGKVCHRGK